MANMKGNTPLHVACRDGHAAAVRLLLEKGAKMNVRGMLDDTPLDMAMECPRGDTREQILDLFREYAPDMVMETWCTQQATH